MHVVKNKKTKKVNPETVAARQALIAMSQEAQDMMEMAENGMELDGFEGCEKVNDFLLVMHQQASGCEQFKTFHDWKKAGYKVKKGSKSYRVWGSPLKAKKQGEEQPAEPAAEGKSDAEKTFKFWPMRSLFTENQVEPIDGDDEPTPPEPSKKIEKPQAEAANDTATQYTQDMGNNESLTRGLFPQPCGEFVAMTFTESKPFKTKAGAIRWLAARGLDESGRSIDEPETEEKETTGESSPFVTSDYDEQQEGPPRAPRGTCSKEADSIK
ncbi:MAG: YdaF family protein [Candidatus Thiodiazotropha sp. (ex Lucinoma aequizonata)]|nr:YdaF family protein [Candidatus Thiodiazotropha sp. (ex Lucinoma aequizonata)]MCU7888867.1 YdaF family protein [Candidatus Thiodiazotropha sp. (ex Lucinoma aequizonata)]MCU7895878.1 YdaF family protein [Candidatus Thiodiazotropha sp. (ex Lucinoma aequizonata)]MCU7898168.1 YdaF family protein [Candidatus Thiodiazotropha sp. (ex Lucinoma aequizonata)]MCU7902671.1 YdaF family protein [Candidatus Thiodiazotropha sp. (ex Lucinoma aequizonata)]